ncbi:TetR/AcrR family transcriptional regulator [Patulibacter brassicae]|jgi:AcrR family transcriptional regulator|uniref:TetR/AcrR family transcriptional regulator n=1 Tax=Patulibacter brassicae TaxID=1705717 RepID=A0ABU4VJH7_9ACTN|nr:TetR/AcrR family transcriptional regulator [Patulibacter brassicae]MDX8151991.1 TetR/AcrR family transcriptional regulator [Patulibacter brassicae]
MTRSLSSQAGKAATTSGRAAQRVVRQVVGGGPPAGGRRTQEERRAETRGKLLDATIRSLVEVGYAATTSRRVAELAGVSRGAQTHHFPHRLDLIAEAYEHLANERVRAMGSVVAAMREEGRGIGSLLDVVWADFSSDLFEAGTKIWIAAADDAELRERLLPVEGRVRRVVRTAIADIAGEHADDARLMAKIDLCISTLRGLALAEAFEPREAPSRIERWAVYRPLLEDLIGPIRP